PPPDERLLHREAAGLIEIPERLGWWRDRAGGVAWLESLPRLAEECAEHWSLRLGEPFGQGHVSLTVPVALSDGGQAVLKLNFPEEESASEAVALIHCVGEWEARGRPVEQRLVDAAAAAAGELAGSLAKLAVCHQDLQGSNVLKAQREPWLAIDPKPIVAEPAFDVASLLRDRRWSIDRAIIQRRLDLLAAELDLNRDRMQGWGVVHALHWGVGPGRIEPGLVECARLRAA